MNYNRVRRNGVKVNFAINGLTVAVSVNNKVAVINIPEGLVSKQQKRNAAWKAYQAK